MISAGEEAGPGQGTRGRGGVQRGLETGLGLQGAQAGLGAKDQWGEDCS